MQIKELKPRQGNADITAEVVEKGDVREFNKFGKTGKVCNAKIQDDSGTISLTLWNEQVDQVKVGDKIHIKNGYVNEWQGELQLTTGKFGSLEVIGSSDNPDADSVTEDELTEEEALENLGKKEPVHALTKDEKTEEEDLEELAEESETSDEDLGIEEENVE